MAAENRRSSANACAYWPRPSPSSHFAMSSGFEPFPPRRMYKAKYYAGEEG